MSVNFPNLFVIGAMKAGTTTLHRLLDLHPSISMSRVKEPCYFLDPAQRKAWGPKPDGEEIPEDLSAYLRLFEPENKRYLGEASTLYAAFPHYSGVPARMFRASPKAKILYLLRDPLDRAVSHLNMDHWNGWGEESWRSHGSVYFQVGNYQHQLTQYLEHFSPSQILLVDFEQLAQNPLGTLNRIFRWLDLDPLPALLDHRVRKNPAWLHYFDNHGWYQSLRDTTVFQIFRQRLSWGKRQKLKASWYFGVAGWKKPLQEILVKKSWGKALIRQREEWRTLLSLASPGADGRFP